MFFLRKLIRERTGGAGRTALFYGIGVLALTILFFLHAAHAATDSSAGSLDQQSILQFLNKVMDWYQHQTMAGESEVSPADIAFGSENLPATDQIVHLSFEFARAATPLLGEETKPVATDSRLEPLRQKAIKLQTESDKAGAEIQQLQEKLKTARGKQRHALESQIAQLNSENSMRQAQLETAYGILGFSATGSSEAGGLMSHIEALERSLPASVSNPKANAPAKAATATPIESPSGPLSIWAALRQSFRLSRDVRTINDKIQRTDELIANVQELENPLRTEIASLVKKSDAIISQPISQDPAIVAQQKASLDAITGQFKLIAAAVLPLSKQAIVLDVYRKHLGLWYDTTKSDYNASLRSLAIRLVVLAAIIAVVLGVFALWRKAILRYITDYRRRYQFMLLRKVVMWFVIAFVIVLGLINQLGSLATFAGLMTAGVAVALQNVILAVAGYFMLIGKFGVGVGDRVEVAGVTAKVVEIGLMRLHVMELTGKGTDAQPTGRMIAFSNSIVFQTAAGLFRQVPGTSFIWRQVSFTLAADSDYRAVERRMLAAVDTAFGGYRTNLERLGDQMEKSLTSIAVGPLAPKLNFKLTPAGLEVTLWFPVEMRAADEMDDRVTRELLRAIDMEPRLKIVAAEIPVIAVKSTAANTASVA